MPFAVEEFASAGLKIDLKHPEATCMLIFHHKRLEQPQCSRCWRDGPSFHPNSKSLGTAVLRIATDRNSK